MNARGFYFSSALYETPVNNLIIVLFIAFEEFWLKFYRKKY